MSHTTADSHTHTENGVGHHAHAHARPTPGVFEEANRQWFDSQAHNCEGGYEAQPAAQDMAKNATAAFLEAFLFDKRQTIVMDFASGTDMISQQVAPHSKKIIGVDISPKSVDFSIEYTAFRLTTHGEVCAYGLHLLLRNTLLSHALVVIEFDFIVCSGAYHHFDDINLNDMTKILTSYLKPWAGALVIVDIIASPEVAYLLSKHDKCHVVANTDGFDEQVIRSRLLMQEVSRIFRGKKSAPRLLGIYSEAVLGNVHEACPLNLYPITPTVHPDLRDLRLMSFGLSSRAVDKFLAWRKGNRGIGYARVEFPFELAWYDEQPDTKFLSFEHRKEYGGFRHEFILLRMGDGSVCRVERTGDPEARTHALTFQGSVAHDLIRSFRPSELEEAHLGNSKVVAEVHLPIRLDLKDVLNICRAIQEAGRTRNYTLQTFNCYFFCLALQCCLTRLVAKWEDNISYDKWKLVAKETINSLLDINPVAPPLHRAYSMLCPRSHPWSAQQFSATIQWHFRRAISNLEWETVANGAFWYHELENTLDNVIKEELKNAWWEAVPSFMNPIILGSESNSSSNNELESLAYECLGILWGIVQRSNNAKHVTAQYISRRSESNMNNREHPRAQVLVDKPGQVRQAENAGRIRASEELEEVNALTFAQWLVILWLHAKQAIAQLIGVFTTLSMALLWVPVFSQDTYTDIELARIIPDLEQTDKLELEQLKELMKKLRALHDIDNRKSKWKHPLWTQVLAAIEQHPSNPLPVEPVVITASLEGQDGSDITVSTFQQHIVKRIELQAKLVQRVGLGSAAKISAELQEMLSLVWATFRNDPFDACIAPVRVMTVDEVFLHLYERGCRNVSNELDKSSIGKYPIEMRGSNDIYSGDLRTGGRVALKHVRLFGDEAHHSNLKLQKTAHELDVWSKCIHPNVLELIGITHYKDQVAIVSPWMDNGNLPNFLDLHPEVDRHDLCSQTVDGIAYLHQQTIVHGDIKGLNILVSQAGEVKITGFGNSTLKSYTLDLGIKDNGFNFSVRWAAPEILDGEYVQSYQGDVYALGMTMLEIITGQVPYTGIREHVLPIYIVIRQKIPERPEMISSDDDSSNSLWSLLTHCWAYNPWSRPTVAEVQRQMGVIARNHPTPGLLGVGHVSEYF